MSIFLPLHALSFLCVILFLIFLYKRPNRKPKKNLPPSPPKLPILCNLHQLGKHTHRSLHSLSQKYGDLMLLRFGSKATLVVSSANAAQEIMKKHDIVFANRAKSTPVRKLFYDGKDVAFASYGESWRHKKSICMLKLLNTTRVRSFQNIREEEIALMVEKIKRSMPSAVNLSKMFATMTNGVVCRAAFNRKYTEDESSSFAEYLDKFVEFLGEFVIGDFVPWLGWIDRVIGLEKKMDKVAKALDGILEGILAERLDSQVNNDQATSEKSEKVKDFVDVLLQAQKENILMDKVSIKGIILDVFAAGTDTISILLVWAMSEILRHPRVLNNLQEELRRLSQGKSSISEDELEKMKYLKAVMKETLRLHPPAPLLVYRESREDVKVNGYDIAARTQVIVNAWAIQRDPSFWVNPNEFYPERFLSSGVDYKGQHFQLIPFGAGRRICPGVQFATIVVELALANLIYAFDWSLPEGEKAETFDMSETTGMSIQRRCPLLAVATPNRFT